MTEAENNPDFPEKLSAAPAFKSLPISIGKDLEQVAILRSYTTGEFVYGEGEPCRGLYTVREGWLKSVKISPNGREQIFRFLGPGATFNEVGILTEGLNQTSVWALEPAKIWIIPTQDILRLLNIHPQLGSIFHQNLAQHVLQLMNLVENLSLHTVEARLARILLEHSTSDVLNRRKWSTQAEMAARLGTVLDVLNRAIKGLADEGLIQIKRHQIIILDRKGLERKAMRGE